MQGVPKSERCSLDIPAPFVTSAMSLMKYFFHSPELWKSQSWEIAIIIFVVLHLDCHISFCNSIEDLH